MDRVIKVLLTGIKNGVKILNIYSPQIMNTNLLVVQIQEKLPKILIFNQDQKYDEGDIVVIQKFRYSQYIKKIQQQPQYILFSSYPVQIATIRISYVSENVQHPLVYLTNQNIDNSLDKLHPKFKEALFQLYQKSYQDNTNVDEINMLRLKGIIVGKTNKIMISQQELKSLFLKK